MRAPDPRSVMVYAAPDDERRAEQLRALGDDAREAVARDVLVVDVADRLDALALCDLHRVAPGAFAVVLIGRDGVERERWEEPVDPADLWACIDEED